VIDVVALLELSVLESVELCLPKRPLAFELAFNWDVLCVPAWPQSRSNAPVREPTASGCFGGERPPPHVDKAQPLGRSRRSSAVGPPIQLVL